MSLNFPADSVLVKSALGHTRKNVDHGVDSIFLVGFEEPEDVNPEGQKCAIEKTVHQEHLTCANSLINNSQLDLKIKMSNK